MPTTKENMTASRDASGLLRITLAGSTILMHATDWMRLKAMVDGVLADDVRDHDMEDENDQQVSEHDRYLDSRDDI